MLNAAPFVTSLEGAANASGALREGAWTSEEDKLMAGLIEAFNNGLVEGLADNAMLREFLARRLSCDPMRITKKLAGKRSMIDKEARYRWWVGTSFQSIAAVAPSGAAGVLAEERCGAVRLEERAFGERLIQGFDAGLLEIPEGTSR